MSGREVVIVGAARTPIGSFLGSLSSLPAPRLGAAAIGAALSRAGVEPAAVDEVVMGNVLQAGVGQAPARQAAILAGVPDRTPAWTLNKVCGSGLKAVISAAQAIALGDAEVVVAGGMESMSSVPYYDRAARTGARMGNAELVDGMIHDGLWDPYGQMHMGVCAEKCARDFDVSRGVQDEYALESTRRAQRAQEAGWFAAEIVPVDVPGRKGERTVVADDEGPRTARPEKIPSLKPAFQKDGTVTAANASSINDGAAALVLMSAERARAEGRPVLGRLTAWGGAARAPVEFTSAPADAERVTLGRAVRGPSSSATTVRSPFLPGTSTGTISAANSPACWACWARRVDSSAYSSCAPREISRSLAHRSAQAPMCSCPEGSHRPSWIIPSTSSTLPMRAPERAARS